MISTPSQHARDQHGGLSPSAKEIISGSIRPTLRWRWRSPITVGFSPTSVFLLQESTEPVKLDQRFCWKQNVNFTFGFSDTLYVQFKTDASYKARGFNCTVICEGFDFAQLFARIPFTEEQEEIEDYDDEYEDDLDEDYIEEDEDYELDE